MRASPKYQRGFWGALIGAVAGGLIAKRSADKQRKENTALQREFAEQGIQTRVEDAKKAGVHPVYALGAQTPQFTPNPIHVEDYGLAESGQNIDRAIEANANRPAKILNRKMLEAQLQATQSQTAQNYAEAQLALSRIRQLEQGGGGSGVGSTSPVMPELVNTHPLQGSVELKPAEQLTTRRGGTHTPASAPSLETVVTPDGRVDLFSPIQMDERLGELGQALALPYLLGHNVRGPVADQFERLWPILTKEKMDRKAKEEADYQRWKKRGLMPRGWEWTREYFNRRR